LANTLSSRADLLERAGQTELARLTRKVHGLEAREAEVEEREEREQREAEVEERKAERVPQLLVPPPAQPGAALPWPRLGVAQQGRPLRQGEDRVEGYRDLAVGPRR
jgi:hypothetical protein